MKEVADEYVWVDLARGLQARLHVLDACADLAALQAFPGGLAPGQPLSAKILQVCVAHRPCCITVNTILSNKPAFVCRSTRAGMRWTSARSARTSALAVSCRQESRARQVRSISDGKLRLSPVAPTGCQQNKCCAGAELKLQLSAHAMAQVALTDIHAGWVDNPLDGLRKGSLLSCKLLSKVASTKPGALQPAMQCWRVLLGIKRQLRCCMHQHGSMYQPC